MGAVCWKGLGSNLGGAWLWNQSLGFACASAFFGGPNPPANPQPPAKVPPPKKRDYSIVNYSNAVFVALVCQVRVSFGNVIAFYTIYTFSKTHNLIIFFTFIHIQLNMSKKKKLTGVSLVPSLSILINIDKPNPRVRSSFESRIKNNQVKSSYDTKQ